MEFEKEEKLFRVIRPGSMFWKSEGKLSSAAFKDKNGLSVSLLENRLKDKGAVVSVKVRQCEKINAVVRYLPIEYEKERNPYHSEIHGSTDKKPLTGSQARALADEAIIEKKYY